MAGSCPHHPSRGDRSPPWVPVAAPPPPGSPATLSATLAPPALALPAWGLVGGKGSGEPPFSPLTPSSSSSPLQGPAEPCSRCRGSRGPDGWAAAGEVSGAVEGGVPHLPTRGYQDPGVRSRCLGMARAGGGDGGGGVGSPASLPCSPLPGLWQAD